MVAQLNLFVDLILKKLLLLILKKLCLLNAHSTLNNCLIVCLLQLIKYSVGVVKIVNKLLFYNFVLGHVPFVCFTIQFTWGNALKSLLIDAILLERYCGHPLVHILVIQNVFYLLCCLTFHIYFMICFWSYSFYYETVFYYLIHILFFNLKILLDLICLLYEFWMLIWQIVVLLMILLHVWPSVLVWTFYQSASNLIVFLKYIFLL